MHGEGIYTFNDGSVFEGCFKGGRKKVGVYFYVSGTAQASAWGGDGGRNMIGPGVKWSRDRQTCVAVRDGKGGDPISLEQGTAIAGKLGIGAPPPVHLPLDQEGGATGVCSEVVAATPSDEKELTEGLTVKTQKFIDSTGATCRIVYTAVNETPDTEFDVSCDFRGSKGVELVVELVPPVEETTAAAAVSEATSAAAAVAGGGEVGSEDFHEDSESKECDHASKTSKVSTNNAKSKRGLKARKRLSPGERGDVATLRVTGVDGFKLKCKLAFASSRRTTDASGEKGDNHARRGGRGRRGRGRGRGNGGGRGRGKGVKGAFAHLGLPPDAMNAAVCNLKALRSEHANLE